MKFTEGQYNQIIETWDLQHTYELGTKAVIKMVNSFNGDSRYRQAEALALANDVTREWAHEQFVEKEKRYVWTSKKEDRLGRRKRLVGSCLERCLVSDVFINLTVDHEYREYLTESEIREWGYDPERFYKEEVE